MKLTHKQAQLVTGLSKGVLTATVSRYLGLPKPGQGRSVELEPFDLVLILVTRAIVESPLPLSMEDIGRIIGFIRKAKNRVMTFTMSSSHPAQLLIAWTTKKGTTRSKKLPERIGVFDVRLVVEATNLTPADQEQIGPGFGQPQLPPVPDSLPGASMSRTMTYILGQLPAPLPAARFSRTELALHVDLLGICQNVFNVLKLTW